MVQEGKNRKARENRSWLRDDGVRFAKGNYLGRKKSW
jgi:hypothetical protein